MNVREMICIWPLAILTVILGVYPSLYLNVIDPAIDQPGDQVRMLGDVERIGMGVTRLVLNGLASGPSSRSCCDPHGQILIDLTRLRNRPARLHDPGHARDGLVGRLALHLHKRRADWVPDQRRVFKGAYAVDGFASCFKSASWANGSRATASARTRSSPGVRACFGSSRSGIRARSACCSCRARTTC
jgi:hypothetical protein